MSLTHSAQRAVKPSLGKPRRSLSIILSALALLSIPLTVLYTAYAIENKPLPLVNETKESRTQVSVLYTQPMPYQAEVTAHGEARPRYQLDLLSEVEGRVISISPKLAIGHKTEENMKLISVESMSYQQNLASAQKRYFEAEIAFNQEKVEAQQLSRSPISELSSNRDIQFAAVKAQVEEAKASLNKAKRDLSNTKVKAPFNAIVVKRNVNLGQYIRAGDTVATLFSTDRIDVKVSIPNNQWNILPSREKLLGYDEVRLTNGQGDVWLGTVTEVSQHINSNNRQKSLIVSVYSPLEQHTPLYAGTFLTVSIPAIQGNNLLEIPVSSLTSSGDIWYVDNAQSLQRFVPKIVFQQEGLLYLEPPIIDALDTSQSLPILARPLPSYVVGQKVVSNNRVAMPLVGENG